MLKTKNIQENVEIIRLMPYHCTIAEPFLDRFNERLDEILSMVEAKPVVFTESDAGCPRCKFEYKREDKDWGEPFCPHCGQALKWTPKS